VVDAETVAFAELTVGVAGVEDVLQADKRNDNVSKRVNDKVIQIEWREDMEITPGVCYQQRG
jgi:hypothetical protein